MGHNALVLSWEFGFKAHQLLTCPPGLCPYQLFVSTGHTLVGV